LGIAGTQTNEIDEFACIGTPDPHERLIRQEFWNQVGSFLDELSRLEREVFLLRFWDQLKLNEIAEVLGNSQSTVKTHLYRALSKIRQSANINRLLLENRND
jgi:RNA polymerase sigma-70 factor (ECF subfamily)